MRILDLFPKTGHTMKMMTIERYVVSIFVGLHGSAEPN